MADFELNQKVRTLELENVRQNQEIVTLKTEVVTLKTESSRQNQEIAALKRENDNLKMENKDLRTKVDECMSSIESLVKKYSELEKRVTGTSTKKENTVHELPSDMPMALLPTVPNPSDSSSSITTAEDMKSLEDKFAKLPAERLAAEMWISTMENLSELSGPATVDLMQKQIQHFTKFITSVSAKQCFSDAVKHTCRERGFSKGVARKMQKLANDIKVQDDS